MVGHVHGADSVYGLSWASEDAEGNCGATRRGEGLTRIWYLCARQAMVEISPEVFLTPRLARHPPSHMRFVLVDSPC